MEENVRSLLAQECFYFRTSLNWAVENELTLDKCLLVMVERGKASVFVGENEYTLERNQILFMRPELPLKKLRSTTDFSVSLMAFPPSMLRDSTERMEPRFLLLLGIGCGKPETGGAFSGIVSFCGCGLRQGIHA